MRVGDPATVCSSFIMEKALLVIQKSYKKPHIDLSISSCDTICLLLTKSWAFSLYLNQFFSDIFWTLKIVITV